ncbi:lactate utilization protein C [Paenibacillus oralis]|uniref:Lactate utilization protein C n=1 Tax=Paenibacillus oralis TaxID=2490856 RepID=A0A3P3UFZ0_9BACL|nr:lactate utilization protein C [Paenibacillus oralis]RRJ67303.1 lactate utilization protein C [Paenibacillus oralis]
MDIPNRDPFLTKLSDKLGRKRPDTVHKPKWELSPQWRVFEGFTQDQLVLQLEKQCKDIHTDVKRTTTSQLVDTLHAVIQAWKANFVIYANDERFDQFGINEYLNNMSQCRKWDSRDKEGCIAFAKNADIGITFSDITLAESGTIVLFNEGIKGRPVSLLPESYIALVPKSSIVPRLTQAVKTIHERNLKGEEIPACVNFISGPSNSADIEMNLVVGVHGPVRTTYIVIDDQ